MIDPDQLLVVAPRYKGGPAADRTCDVLSVETDADDRRVIITFASGATYCYRHPKARLLVANASSPPVELAPDEVVFVSGRCWVPPLTMTLFTDVWDPSFSMVRVSRPARQSRARRPGSDSDSAPVEEVLRYESASRTGSASQVCQYWRQAVGLLDPDSPLRKAHEDMTFIHPDSALAAYLEAQDSGADFPDGPIILPFRSNEDQRDAVAKALRNQVSVIDGPPGTGKTETILNLIANILLVPGQTVGVVSFGNAAVDNVRDKLAEAGIDFVAARVGRANMVKAFLADQDAREGRLTQWLAGPAPQLPVASPASPSAGEGLVGAEMTVPVHPAADLAEEVAATEDRLVRVWRARRELAQLRNLIDAYTLESAHLERRTENEPLPELVDLPLLRKDSETILDYLAETRVRPGLPEGVRGLFPRLRRYFRYGRLGDLDPTDAATVLRLERTFYANRLKELRQEEERLTEALARLDEETAQRQHQELSRALLDRALRQRYTGGRPYRFDDGDRRIGKWTRDFLAEYPVVLTTCHSIRWNLSEGTLLDWVIIDEATQTSLLTAALAMSRARNVVVVGDLKQLGHFLDKEMTKGLPPAPAPGYDIEEHSILSSVTELYGEQLARTMLREHFRCHPVIIEFCNRMYYDGELIPCRPGGPSGSPPPMVVRRTAPGNHARTLRNGPTGTYNQREIDDIEDYLDAVLADAGADLERKDDKTGSDYELGVTTPYRLQADRLAEALNGSVGGVGRYHWLAETVHKFQGRGAREMVLSTVVDETRLGHIKLRFVDDPRLINVAVSRAKDRFVLVTNHDEVPRSTHIKALIDYIRFQDPDQVVDSRIVSVFDLLYQEYSPRLEHFARRVYGSSRYKSENIIGTRLNDILAEPPYQYLQAVPQVRLRDLLPGTDLLDERQKRFVRSVSSVDFAVYHTVTRSLLLAIEVNGTRFHEDSPEQRERDKIKKAVLAAYGVSVLPLRTNDSGEEEKIRAMLDQVLAGEQAHGF
ncbi:DUF2726 domain-containing protein [Actinomyces lilanjuaniae]|uniref:DUF2726 domain-containing protein n=1 Tax=Actinomyces lilanjuaniae TaxID=2321394 RepID=A0ABM6Z1X7_9ACTO|nr:AAA domain-containing protein [Actinomyces lilanjuaniae]AYD89135.1 DUF2726 domain-containing protein [Actinomyces lilanjuaniae]